MSDGVRVVAQGSPSSGGRRGPWIVAGAIVVALVVGGIVGRATAPTHHDRSPSVAPGAGPSRTVAGVGVGYPHTRAGAIAAVIADGALLSDPRVLLNRRRRTQVLGLIATNRYAATFSGPAAAALNATAKSRPTVFFAAPIAYRLTAYSSEAATVTGWGVSVAGSASVGPAATWGRSATTVRWVDGDWKIDAVRATTGPTPAMAEGQHPSSTATFVTALRGTRGLRHVP
jgi:hypothetical protein